jgi:hypothetical protein
MSDLNDKETLEILIEEFSQLRNELKQITQKMTKIEKRISVAYPIFKELKNKNPHEIQSGHNRVELLKIFDELIIITKEKGDIGSSIKLKEFSKETLIALALELGVPGSKKMGINKAISGIKGRIQESIRLS